MSAKSKIKDIPLLHEAIDKLGFYNNEEDKADIGGFAKATEIEYQTLKTWERNGRVSPLGIIALENIIKNKKLEDDLRDYHELKNLLSRITK